MSLIGVRRKWFRFRQALYIICSGNILPPAQFRTEWRFESSYYNILWNVKGKYQYIDDRIIRFRNDLKIFLAVLYPLSNINHNR